MTAAETVARALDGRPKTGGGFMVRCPCHPDRVPSLSVDDGDDGVLLVKCFADCDPVDILRELAGRDLLPEHERPRKGTKRRSVRTSEKPIEPDQRALAIWRAAVPIAGTLAETYLQHRGIRPELPLSLRFVPSLRYYDGGGSVPLALPAMVAGIQAADRRVVAVHRTYLRLDGTDKAAVASPKKMLGSCAGGAVRLAAAGEELTIAEGIETALAVMQATGRPVWAALSTSGMRSLVLPPNIRRIIIAADGDKPGIDAAEAAAAPWMTEGRDVCIAHAPPGYDFADVLAGDDFKETCRA